MLRSLMSTRAGTLLVAAVAALLAGGVLFVYMAQYRDSLHKGSQMVTVLVADRLIPQNTPGGVVAAKHEFAERRIREDAVKDGAITDPGTLKGLVAADDIVPGEQLVSSQFVSTPSDALAYKLSGDQRAISVSVDAAHGLIGDVRTGDRVDVLGGFNVIPIDKNGVPQQSGGTARPVLKTLMSNILVLSAPSSGSSSFGGQSTKQIVLRVTDQQSAELAFASDNGKVWIVLEPQAGAAPTPTSFVTLETLLLGVKPITVIHGFGGKSS
jgi:Flp pilus assembly protein CpaB